MGKKKFIDKKKAVTFRLVNRSQQDPLFVDENAPQHVLVPVSAPGRSGDDDPRAPSRASTSAGGKVEPEKRKQEQAKFGVYFDDDYDYLQHLREPGRNEVYWEPVQPAKTAGAEKVSIKLPSSVFASEVEEEDGLMKKKALMRPGPRPDWDPDVVAALDEDFDHENPDNALEDNFMELAMGGEREDDYFDEGEEDEYSDVDSNEAGMSDDDEERDGLGPLAFDREETKSRFTEYSMSSSVIRRNEQLSLLDDRFEKFYEQYDDPELGALDCEDIEGHVDINDSVLMQYAEEYRKERDEKYEVAYDKQWDKESINTTQHKKQRAHASSLDAMVTHAVSRHQFTVSCASRSMSVAGESELHSAVRETIAECLPYDYVLALIESGVDAAGQNQDGLSAAELALVLEPAGRLATAMVIQECEALQPVDVLKRIIVRGNLFLFEACLEHLKKRLGSEVTVANLEQTFAELKTRNVLLSADIDNRIHYLLVEADYQQKLIDDDLVNDTEQRVLHLVECTEFLEVNYRYSGKFNDMDDRFDLYLRQILEHVFFLKNRFKLLPLMQLQFCLATFLRAITGGSNEHVDIYGFMLDKEIVIDFLTTLKKVLKRTDSGKELSVEVYFECLVGGRSKHKLRRNVIADIRQKLRNCQKLQQISQASTFNDLTPEEIIYLNKCCQQQQSQQRQLKIQKRFRALFRTYHAAKSFYSITKMITTIATLRDLNLDENSPNIAVSIAALKRALQTIGETIKSTRQTPNITRKLDTILQSFSSQPFATLAKDLRQFFSHDYSLAKQRLDDTCPLDVYRKIRENLLQSEQWLAYSMFLQKVYAFKQYLVRLNQLESIDRMRSYVKFIGTEFLARLQSDYEPRKLNEALLLVDHLLSACFDEQQKKVLQNVKRQITMSRNGIKNDVGSVALVIDEYFFLGKYILQQSASVDRVRAIVKCILQSSSKHQSYESADTSTLRTVSDTILKLQFEETDGQKNALLEAIWHRLMKDSVSGIQSLNRRLVVREDETMEETTAILSELGLCGNVDFVRMVNARLSNKYYQNLFDLNNKYHVLNEVVKDRRSGGNVKELQRKLKQMRWADERLFQQKFDGIIDSIRKVLEQSGTPIDRFALEYHVLEATEILCSLKIFQDNMASLKTIAPVITGRNLRNYLAHDPLAYDALAGSCSTIESNAMFFVQNRVKLYQSKVVPGRSKAVCNFIFERKVAFTNEQQNVFEAVKAFDVSTLRCLVSKDKTLLLGRTQLDSDLLSIALNGDPIRFIDQLLNSHGDNNFFRYFLETSTNVALKQKLAHILKDPHQFCYLTAVRFELTDTLLLLRLHPQVDPTLSNEALVSIFTHYSPDSFYQLLHTFPVEQFLRDQRLQNTIIHWAVLRGDLQLVRCALHRHRTLLNESNVLGESPLALAVRYGFRDVARLLIEHGADVLRSKWTPVWIAACLGDLEMVRMLLAGEVISGRNNPLVAAVEHDQLEVFAYLHESCGYSLKDDCLLHKSVQLGRVRFVRYIVESEEGRMIIDGLNTFCFTALMTAAACGRFDLFSILVQSGADPYFSNEFGYNVLHCAVYTGKRKIVDYLLQLPEMDVNARTADELNALGIAVGQNNLAMVEYLLGKNTVPTASHVLLAGYYKRYNLLRMLLDRDQSLLEARDVTGRNLLMYVVIDRDLPMVNDLIARGIDVNARSRGGFTALLIAACNYEVSICDLLISAGADLEAVDDNSKAAGSLVGRGGDGRAGGRRRVAEKVGLREYPVHVQQHLQPPEADRGATQSAKDQHQPENRPADERARCGRQQTDRQVARQAGSGREPVEAHRSQVPLRRQCNLYAERAVDPAKGRNARGEARAQEAAEGVPRGAANRAQGQHARVQGGEEAAGEEPTEQPRQRGGKDRVRRRRRW
ncbi:conserved hypothetical protein [Culex quinquefasciatus]|uniref:Protein LTV1 homolog n=1 Tax=Culex quinquefasciatus TaxID=7176 RepID=B0XDA1_CULQU|nr:conserved hypothetical protein [Culex quinquefasciatus]|eukprot:XP_001867623.1 conserved hypothetical protein [Culex quinquefasciatus]